MGGIINANQVFELQVKYIWPFLRHLVKKSKRCKICIVSENYTSLKDGICGECLKRSTEGPIQELEATPEEHRLFDQVMKSYIRGVDRYDVILLLSGGKDSAYILQRLKNDYPKLQILCVLVNNGFMSPFAIHSAKWVADMLHTDLLIINSEINQFNKTLRQAFLDLQGRESYGVVDKADGDLIFAIGRKTAIEMKIPVMLAGLSWVQLQKIFGINDFQLVLEDGLPTVFPLAVWRTNEQEIRSIVREAKLMPPGSDSPMVSNHAFVLPMCVVDNMNIGYCSFEPEFAQLVREGKTDRKTWLYTFELLEFATKKGLLKKELKDALRRINLTIDDVVKGKK